MTTTDTMDTAATVEQTIRCIEAGAELVRITAPSKREAENLLNIKNELRARGYTTPLVADIHFTPNAAEIAARIVEKVRVNPGNYVDKKKFELIEYTDADYADELTRIKERFVPLVRICKEYGTAMRIGTNHGSLSDRIMSRYGDTPMGMVESAMEFLRIARSENYHQVVLSMKSSNPLVMVQAYRLLVKCMQEELGECYPLHLGVTEAGDGEDGRIKSAIGIGTLLEDGIGDTIRVSLTEDPEFELPVCKDIAKRYESEVVSHPQEPVTKSLFINDIMSYSRRESFSIDNIGGGHVPVVIADLSKIDKITPVHLQSAGYIYDSVTDKWNIGDAAADFIFTGHQYIDFELPGTLKVIVYPAAWEQASPVEKYFPIYEIGGFINAPVKSTKLNFVMLDEITTDLDKISNDPAVVLCLSSKKEKSMIAVREMYHELVKKDIRNPVITIVDSNKETKTEHLIHFAIESGGLLLDGFGDGICLGLTSEKYAVLPDAEKFLNDTAFNILQATRTRISKTEYISCPSCGRTLFDLQETTARIRAVTNHLKGVKIAIMGCIVNGPGEMADADFGYVGSGPGKITLYKGKDIIKRNVSSDIAVQELVELLKQNNAWTEPVKSF
jgi:(E)-4-hydroxy-3-methylbut-2-enyl-diphosphate synthase